MQLKDRSTNQEILTPAEILKKYWGYESFRPKQEDIILSILAGRDTLALMPTGGGKSICFQVPALLNEGLCLVVSPLIALMKDQVANLKKKGIPALSIFSGMTHTAVKNTLQNAMYGNFKFLYVSPERLETELFLEFLPGMTVNLIAVDEAHCISQWGYDFRPPYLRIADIRKQLAGVPILALTASATPEVQKDICEKLVFKKGYAKFNTSFERANLSYSVFNPSSKQNKLIEILKKVQGSGIVYCKSRRRTRDIAELLNLNGISSSYYHAGLTSEERSDKQEAWINNSIRIIACTNAFGMGIDKPDVRTVVHYDVPDALENYYQEAGRAGRDGQKAYAVLLFGDIEIQDLKKISDIRFPGKNATKEIYRALINYLQLPAGSGEGLSFDFNISDFVKKFKLDAFIVNSVLKILEQEELISYSEQFFSPSTVVFTAARKQIEEFEIANPGLEPVVKGLLRSYDGIFDYPTTVRENDLSKFLSVSKARLITSLHAIQKNGIIQYNPQKETPQVSFLENRVAADDLNINEKNILRRKRAFDTRLNAMLHYTNELDACRSKMIAEYFDDKDIKRCSICDNCLRVKKPNISTPEFKVIHARIMESITTKGIQKEVLLKKIAGINSQKINTILNFLIQEEIIFVTADGLLKLSNGKR